MRSIRRSRFPWLLIGVAAAAGLLFAWKSDAWRKAALALVARGIRLEFADVRRISTAELAQTAKSMPTPVLLDGREAAEFAVSHLPGARSFPPGSDPAQTLADLPKDASIVIYCSVGYRSALAARTLTAAGFRDVRNLEGSIFQWANEDRPLVRGGDDVNATVPTSQVHPYNPRWGLLLRPERRADVDAPSR
jgi:rhodanese-related sulfurtransferase